MRSVGRAIGECHDWADRGSTRPVRHRRHRCGAVAQRVQAWNRLAEVIQYLPVRVRAWAALGVQRPADHQHRVVRPAAADRPQRRVFAAGLVLDRSVELQLDGRLAENFNALLSTCQQRHVAVQTVKSIAYKPWMGHQHTLDTWYEPLDDQQEMDGVRAR